jgi:hypothetical protein
VWAERKGEWKLASLPVVDRWIDSMAVQRAYLLAGGAFAILAFLAMGGNRFTSLNVFLWIMALVCIILGFWQHDPAATPWLERLRGYLVRERGF